MCLREYLQSEANRRFFQRFVESKFGYGCWNARYWFVGPEEGGGVTCTELTTRLQAWQQIQPQPDLVDLRDFHKEIESQFYQPKPKKQPTWCGLLSLLGHRGDQDSAPKWLENDFDGSKGWILDYQVRYLAQPKTASCKVALLDVSPLPSPGGGVWIWGALANLFPTQEYACFETRSAFLRHIVDQKTNETRISSRLRRIKEQAERFKPALILFYGLNKGFAKTPMKEVFQMDPPTSADLVQHGSLTDETHLFWTYHPLNRQEGMKGSNYRAKVQRSMEEHGCTPWNDE